MDIGYARVSTAEQILDLQLDALHKAGCGKIFTETAGGSLVERVSLREALAYVRPGDTLVVWRLDRLGRSLTHLIETVRELSERGVGFRSLQEQIDTTTSGGSSSSMSSVPSLSSSGTSSGSGPTQGCRQLEPAA